jgi:predicted enzyme related to lactoylglutathione lyase
MRSSHRARDLCRLALLAASLSAAFAAPVAAEQIQRPAIVAPANQEHHTGKMIFTELVTPDLAAAKQFYGGLFGWTFRDSNVGAMPYAEALLAGHPVAGLLQKPIPAGEQHQSAWLSFFSVPDVDAAAQTAVRSGAKILFDPHSFPDRGREAVLADPQGAVFAVLASSSGDPPDVLAADGAWIWSSLITTDPDSDAAFYKTLLGYDIFQLPPLGATRASTHAPARTDGEHLLLASENYARASVNSPPPNLARFHPHWINFARVEDTDAMAAKAVALGGRVLVAPRVDRHGGKIALIADPQGTPFGLLEWVDDANKEMSR